MSIGETPMTTLNTLLKSCQPSRRLAVWSLALTTILLAATPCLAQQDPWSQAATRMADVFTGPIARGFSLVAIVLGGLNLAFGDGGGKRAIGGVIFGCGMAVMAVNFLTWILS